MHEVLTKCALLHDIAIAVPPPGVTLAKGPLQLMSALLHVLGALEGIKSVHELTTTSHAGST